MTDTPLYPLRFEPIFQYRPWGGRRLAALARAPLPGGDDNPIGEAWLLSDRNDHASVVANGPLKGLTIGAVIAQSPELFLGRLAKRFSRFPLLLKFLDARDTLSVQVHPSDGQAKYLPAGERGKTEAWVVLEAGAESRVYAGLKAGVTADDLRRAVVAGTVPDQLASFQPVRGDSVLIEAGTVHTMGGLVVFEVQENSDVTFRLYDWDHVDPRTGKPRALQVDEAMACIDFSRGAVEPTMPVVEMEGSALRERIVRCEHFEVWRLQGESPTNFTVGAEGAPRVLVCIAGDGELEHDGGVHPFRTGDVMLLPAAVGACLCTPIAAVTMLEIAVPE
jgi:mannose-6-phosphate isomerase